MYYYIDKQTITRSSLACDHTDLQSQNAVTADLTSKQLLPYGFARLPGNQHAAVFIHSPSLGDYMSKMLSAVKTECCR